jgi:hypothetical protein
MMLMGQPTTACCAYLRVVVEKVWMGNYDDEADKVTKTTSHFVFVATTKAFQQWSS